MWYLNTDSDSDANIVKILHLRSQLVDLILNFGNIDDKKWPQTFDETKERSDAHVREYGEAIQFHSRRGTTACPIIWSFS